MVKYETTFIVPEETSAEPVSKIIEAAGAKPGQVKEIGVKSFTYPIAKLNAGRYFCLRFEAEADQLPKIEKALKAEKSVLRYLLVKELRVRAPRPPRIVESGKLPVSPEARAEVGKVEDGKAEKPVVVKSDKAEAITTGEKPQASSTAPKKPAEIATYAPAVPSPEPAPVVKEKKEKEGLPAVEEKPAIEKEKEPSFATHYAEATRVKKATEGLTASPEEPAKSVKKPKEPAFAKASAGRPKIEIDKLDEKLKDLVGEE
jgi:ribosomal protein S6